MAASEGIERGLGVGPKDEPGLKKGTLSVKRAVAAFAAFNAYSFVLIVAFASAARGVFPPEDEAAADVLSDWQVLWGDHYLWRLFAACVVTYLAGFLAGAIARTRGKLVAAVSNIPSVLGHALAIWALGFLGAEDESTTGFLVVYALAIPLTTGIAYVAGGLGERAQADKYEDGTVLGIWPYHWLWLLLPLPLYAAGTTVSAASFARFYWMTLSDDINVAVILAFLLALLPLLAWLAPLWLSYRILTRQALRQRGKAVKGLAVLALFVCGPPVAVGIELICYWLLKRFLYAFLVLVAGVVAAWGISAALRKRRLRIASTSTTVGSGNEDLE